MKVLRVERVERFLDRSELAERADLNKRTIEQLETGHYPTGSRLSTIRRLAEALGVDPRELLED